MEDDIQPQSSPATAAGGCALGSGLVFVLVGVVSVLVFIFSRHYDPGKVIMLAFVAGPLFTLCHILAIVAIQSSSDLARERGKRALVAIWIAVAFFFVVYLILFKLAPPAVTR